MMISPSSVSVELRGASENEIRRAIRGYKNRIGWLKKKIENGEDECMLPSYDTQLKVNREYLNSAILALEIAGYEYKSSKREEKSQRFNERVNDLRQIELSEDVFFGAGEKYLIKFSENSDAELEYSHTFYGKCENVKKIVSKQEIIERLKGLFIGEWKRNYFAPVLDGVSWSLKLEFFNHNAKTYHGSNAFPFSYNEIKELFKGLLEE